MNFLKQTACIGLALGFSAGSLSAAACDWRLSAGIAAFGTGGAAVAAAGVAMKGAGFYKFIHASSAAAMLGSTLPGASGAGTIGIMGGTAGTVGTVGGILMSPVVIAGAAVVAVGAVGFEGVCYFEDERITDYDEVLSVLRGVSNPEDPMSLMLINPDVPGQKARLVVRSGLSTYESYNVADLYIVNGSLMNRDWFLNTEIGYLGGFQPTVTAN